MKRENLCLSNLKAHSWITADTTSQKKKIVESGRDFEAFAIDLYEAQFLIIRLRTEFESQLFSEYMVIINSFFSTFGRNAVSWCREIYLCRWHGIILLTLNIVLLLILNFYCTHE